MKFLLPLLALLLFAAPAQAAVPEVGQPAPAFSMPAHDGTAMSLASFKGKWLVLYFYPKDASPVCSVEAKKFQDDLDKYKALNAVIAGVSVDDVESHVKFRADQGLGFALLSDAGAEVSARYGSELKMGFLTMSARNTFVIDPEGVVRKVYIGVDTPTHSAQVLKDLAELQKK